MTPILSNIKNLKSSVRNVTDIFATQKKDMYSENPISIRQNGVKLQLIKEDQISRQMTIYMVKIKGILNARTNNVLA